MKKLILFLLSTILAFGILSGCNTTTTDVVFYVPDGGTLLPVAKLLTDNEPIMNGYNLKGDRISGTEIESKLSSGAADIAIAPINLCAKAFNDGNDYVLAAIAVWGNSYIVANSATEKSYAFTDLEGEIIYAFQEAGVPGITLKAVLQMNDVDFTVITDTANAVSDKVNLLFLATPAAVQTELVKPNSSVNFAVLPEPNATAQTASGNRVIAFDIQRLWDREDSGISYPQAGLIIKKSVIETHSEFVAEFLSRMEQSAQFCLDNPAQTAALAKDDLQSAALPSVELIKKYIEGNGREVMRFKPIKDVKENVVEYLQVLEQYNAAAIGGKLPSEGFYY